MSKDNKTVDRIQAVWNMIGGDFVVDQLLAGKAKIEIKILYAVNSLTIALSEEVTIQDFHNFFNDRKGILWVAGDFRRWIGGAATELCIKSEIELGYVDIPEHVSRRGKLPEGHVFESHDVLVLLFELLQEQEYGKSGHLLADGGSNSFYVKELEKKESHILVYWDKSRGWCCGIGHDDGLVRAGDTRVFTAVSPVT